MVTRIEIFSKDDFREWLSKNHEDKKIVELLIHKKHTGKKSPSHRKLLNEALCFGWVDTIIKRVDEDTYIRTFQRRSKNSKWSQNTLSYAKKLIKEKRMTPHGLKFYKEGLKKKPFDHGIPKNPKMPEELKRALGKDKKAHKRFKKLSPSKKRSYYRWILHGKMSETRMKRSDKIIKRMNGKDWKVLKF